jgi:hypothetical protein
MAAFEDVVAVAVAIAAAAWLARGFIGRLGRPGCGGSAPPAPGGADGFVPIDRLTTLEKGRKKTRTDP